MVKKQASLLHSGTARLIKSFAELALHDPPASLDTRIPRTLQSKQRCGPLFLKNVRGEQSDYLTKLRHVRDLYLTETYLYATPRRNIGSIPLPIKPRPRENLTHIRSLQCRVPFRLNLCGDCVTRFAPSTQIKYPRT